MKKRFISVLCLTLTLSILGHIEPAQAIDFANNEEKYMKLCSGSQLGRNESTCRQFNTYLKNKNKELKDSIDDTKDQLISTKNSISSIESQISALTDEIAKKENEISYLNTSIKNYQKDINKKDKEVRERMFAMQSYNNNSGLIDFIFGAENFGDFFSRIASINEITEYDEELVKTLVNKKKEVESQKTIVASAKANIESQRKQKQQLQNEYQTLYNKQNNLLENQQQQQKNVKKAQGQLESALSQLVKESQSSSSGVKGDSKVGQAIANKALSRQGYMYLWGGCHSMEQIRNPNTTRFDCSGLVCWAHYQAGVNIGVQFTGSLSGMGRAVTASQLQAGDIILFNNSSGSVCHVGIAINNSQMVHAPETGKPVQVANLTSGWRARVRSYRRLY